MRATELINQAKITEIYRALSGGGLRGKRGRAFWRNADGSNVSLDDNKGSWYDFVTHEGGGVLSLVQRVRGGTKSEALRWVADFAGVPLNDHPLSAEDRQRWARERQLVEQHLPNAQRWHRAAVQLLEEALDTLKAALSDPAKPWPEVNEIYDTESRLSRLLKMEGAELVSEYLTWAKDQPHTTVYLVDWAKRQERVERAAALAFLGISEPTE